MLGKFRLVSDTMGEFYDLLKPWTDESFWDFGKVESVPGTIYVFGRQHFVDHLARLKDMANSGQYIIVYGNSAEGAWPLETQLKQYGIDQLAREGKILVVGGAECSPEYVNLAHEHFLPRILDYEENLQAQSRTDEIFAKVDKPYKFLFLNGRARPHRKYAYEKLHRLGLLDQALWTMLDSNPTGFRFFEFKENGVDVMSLPSPIKLLPEHYEVDRYRTPRLPNMGHPNINVKYDLFNKEWGEIYLEPAPYIDTYFSLVTETVCYESPYSFRTEKIAKPLAMGHPFIVISNAGFYKDLHNMGFKTFGHIIDESFDKIDHGQARVDRIIQVVEDLCQQDLASFLKECYTVCKYNQQHLVEVRDQVRREFPDRFFNFIKTHSQ